MESIIVIAKDENFPYRILDSKGKEVVSFPVEATTEECTFFFSRDVSLLENERKVQESAAWAYYNSMIGMIDDIRTKNKTAAAELINDIIEDLALYERDCKKNKQRQRPPEGPKTPAAAPLNA